MGLNIKRHLYGSGAAGVCLSVCLSVCRGTLRIAYIALRGPPAGRAAARSRPPPAGSRACIVFFCFAFVVYTDGTEERGTHVHHTGHGGSG